MRTYLGTPIGDVRVKRLALLLMLPLLACTGDPSTAKGVQAQTDWSGTTTVQLVAGNDTVVGTVTAAIDNDELSVTYALNAPWSMTESHLDVETDVRLFPQTPKQHNPIPGHFAFHAEHSPAVTEYTYHKAISWQPGDTLYIAAQAEVQRTGDCAGDCRPSGDDGDGAWAAGTRFTTRGSKATYFTFRPTVQAVLGGGDKWMLTRVAGQTTDGTNTLFDDSLYMLQDATGIAESPLPADIKADLAADSTDPERFVVVSQSIVSEIVASEQAGALTPALQAIAEPLDPPSLSGQNPRGLFGKCSDKAITKSKTINLDNLSIPLFSQSLPGNVSTALTLKGNVSGAVTIEMHLTVHRINLFLACIPISVNFNDLHAFGTATVDAAATLDGTVSFSESFEKELLKPTLFDLWFMFGPVPVRVLFNLPISAGIDLDASVTGSVTYDSGQKATGSLDYTCTLSGCTGRSSFQLAGSSAPATLTGSISGRVQPSVWAEVAFRGALYSDRLAYAQVGARPFLRGDLWGFVGNDCGDGDGDGVNETVKGLTFDLDSELTANFATSVFNKPPSRHELFSAGRHHLKFFDLIGSTALGPLIQGSPSATAGQPASYTVSMRPCWPYTDRVRHTVAWGDGTLDTLSDVPPDGVTASHVWLQAGSYALGATSLSDEHGRSLNQSTSRDVEVTAVVNQPIPTAGLHLWLRADAGVSSPPAGTKISGWADQSGNGRNASMATVARQPELVPGALNGLPVVRFNGAQSLSLDKLAEPVTFSVFIVGKNSKAGTESIILGPGGTSPNNQLRWEDDTRALFVGTGNGMPVILSPIGNTHVYHALSARYDGANMTVYRDGGAVSSHSFTTSGPWTFASVGSFFSSVFMEGDLAEVLIYDRPLSEPERLTVNGYLRTKYGLP